MAALRLMVMVCWVPTSSASGSSVWAEIPPVAIWPQPVSLRASEEGRDGCLTTACPLLRFSSFFIDNQSPGSLEACLLNSCHRLLPFPPLLLGKSPTRTTTPVASSFSCLASSISRRQRQQGSFWTIQVPFDTDAEQRDAKPETQGHNYSRTSWGVLHTWLHVKKVRRASKAPAAPETELQIQWADLKSSN